MFWDLRRLVFCRPFHGLRKKLCRPNPAMNCWAILGSSASRTLRAGTLLRFVFFSALLFCLLAHDTHAQVGDYEGRPVSTVEVVLEGTPADTAAQNEFKSTLRISDGG